MLMPAHCAGVKQSPWLRWPRHSLLLYTVPEGGSYLRGQDGASSCADAYMEMIL